MLRTLLRTSFTINMVFPFSLASPDNLHKETNTEKNVDISKIQKESGWDRVKRMYQADEFGNLSKELVTITHVGAMSLFVGGVYGGIQNSKGAYMNFIQNNQATAFHDHIEAKKKLQDAVTKSFGRGAFKWAWRLSLFCTTFAGISTTISVYRGKTGIVEYVAAGVVSGSLYKLNMGPRGWIVGGGLGAVLGFTAGCVTLGLMKLTGMSMDEVYYWQQHWEQERSDYVNKGISDYLAKEEGEVIQDHNRRVGNAGKILENLDVGEK